MNDQYELTHTYIYEDENHRSVVNVFSPVISEEEKEKRMNEIKKAASALMREAYKIKQ